MKKGKYTTIKKIFKQSSWWLSVITLGIALGSFLQLAKAWVGPPSSPPSGNIGAPVTTGGATQHKSGVLQVGALVSDSLVISKTFNYHSDRNLKKEIHTLDNSLNKVSNLRGVNFQWKDQENQDQIGLIAQEVEEVYPELVHTSANGTKSVEYGSLVAPLIESVKELKKQNQELESRLKKQQDQIENLYEQVNSK
ncbi:MAG: tail fiber domain-containing protein [Candidatus Moraniibacteriota bacterium]